MGVLGSNPYHNYDLGQVTRPPCYQFSRGNYRDFKSENPKFESHLSPVIIWANLRSKYLFTF